MTITTPSEAETEGTVAAGPERDEQASINKQLLSLGPLRDRLIKKLFVPSSGEASWASLPATN